MTDESRQPSAEHAMSRRNYARLAGLLALLIALDALTIDVSLPAMPAIAVGLSSNYAGVELALSAYLFGISLGQLFQGPISDRWGRRPVLLTGLTIYILATLACMVAPSMAALIAFRFIQGLAVSSGQILARAIVRDKYARDDAARLLSIAMIGLAAAPIVAPLLGSVLTNWLGWRAIFGFLALYAIVVTILIWRFLDETHTKPNPTALAAGQIIANFRVLIVHRIFWAYVVCGIAAFSGLFVFLTSSSGVFINYFGLEPQQYGFVFAAMMIGHGIALLAGASLVKRFGLDRLLMFGVILALASGLAAAAISWTIEPGQSGSTAARVFGVAAPIAVYLVAFALIIPQSVAGAMAPFPTIAGASSSLMGFLQFAIAALSVAAVSYFSDGSERAMVTAIAISGIVAFSAWWFLVRPLSDRH